MRVLRGAGDPQQQIATTTDPLRISAGVRGGLLKVTKPYFTEMES